MIKLELLVILPPRPGFPTRHRRSGVVLGEVDVTKGHRRRGSPKKLLWLNLKKILINYFK